jgi:hypothetical protein
LAHIVISTSLPALLLCSANTIGLSEEELHIDGSKE